MVSANGTVIDHNVPCPQSYCVPLERGKKRKTEFLISFQHTEILFIPQDPTLFFKWKKKKSYQSRAILYCEFISATREQLYIPLPHLSDPVSPSSFRNIKVTTTVPFFVKKMQTSAFLFKIQRQVLPQPEFWWKGQCLGERPIQMPFC